MSKISISHVADDRRVNESEGSNPSTLWLNVLEGGVCISVPFYFCWPCRFSHRWLLKNSTLQKTEFEHKTLWNLVVFSTGSASFVPHY